MDAQEQRQVWTPIEFSDSWRKASTAKFDVLAPSWYKKRETLTEDDEDYKEFLERLKREHAIETGIVERLYDLSDGITETFTKEGFIDTYIGHDDSTIKPSKLMAYLRDHFDALDFVYNVVYNKRDLSVGFIKELHCLLTTHQYTTYAVNGLGRGVNIELRKGEFKKHPNNPRRSDGVLCLYCPPEQVDSEMDSLIRTCNAIADENPIVVSAWFHHAFTQIHPFQDGNGRMARLLSSLIWIKEGLFPLIVKRTEKSTYIKALEEADSGNPGSLVAFFSEKQSNNIDRFLNYKKEVKPKETLVEIARAFGRKVDLYKQKLAEERRRLLDDNRKKVYDETYKVFGQIHSELKEAFAGKDIKVWLKSVSPEEKDAHWYTKQIVDYASPHNYYFNKSLPRFWFKLTCLIADKNRYDLIVTAHHSGYTDSVMAIGAFTEFFEEKDEDERHTDHVNSIPIALDPYKISLEKIDPELLQNVEGYIRDIIKIGLTLITNDIV